MKKIWLIFIFLLFTGCSLQPTFEKSDPVFVVLKSKKMRYADSGFIKTAKNRINLQLFSAGTAILDLILKDDICVNKICYKKENFNVQFLGFKYYDDFLADIMLHKPIYGGKNMEKIDNGFRQKITSKHLDIFYQVTQKETYFKDKNQKILIKIKKNQN